MNWDISSSKVIDTSSPRRTCKIVEGIAQTFVEGLPALSFTSYQTLCHAFKAKIMACLLTAVYPTAGAKREVKEEEEQPSLQESGVQWRRKRYSQEQGQMAKYREWRRTKLKNQANMATQGISTEWEDGTPENIRRKEVCKRIQGLTLHRSTGNTVNRGSWINWINEKEVGKRIKGPTLQKRTWNTVNKGSRIKKIRGNEVWKRIEGPPLHRSTGKTVIMSSRIKENGGREGTTCQSEHRNQKYQGQLDRGDWRKWSLQEDTATHSLKEHWD